MNWCKTKTVFVVPIYFRIRSFSDLLGLLVQILWDLGSFSVSLTFRFLTSEGLVVERLCCPRIDRRKHIWFRTGSL